MQVCFTELVSVSTLVLFVLFSWSHPCVCVQVRNPLSAAMSACSFLKSTIEGCDLPRDDPSRISATDDLNVISSSINHVIDLLRGILEFHKSSANGLSLDVKPTDLLKDIFEPAKIFVHRKDDAFGFDIDCPADLIVQTDPMRLRQVCLNLAGNSRKFVEQGFIRFCADVVDGSVRIRVEDSGPGIPAEKKKALFDKFQQSLDSLNQGTGLGLSLCKTLVELMGGTISLDEDFDSGVKGCPGTCFVIDLKKAPMQVEDIETPDVVSSDETKKKASDDMEQIPPNLNVLVTDDDRVLRKLISRSLKRIAPTWTLSEASNGETALVKAQAERYDMIFMDQYMAAIEKQLLGTETCREMRASGIDSIICGLSANDKEAAFRQAGADGFMLKPLPTDQADLAKQLAKVISEGIGRLGQNPSQLQPHLETEETEKSLPPENGAVTRALAS